MRTFFRLVMRGVWWAVDGVVSLGSGEWMLGEHPNGGAVVFARSLLTTAIVYAVAVGVRSRLEPGATWLPSLTELRTAVHDTLPWAGAIFAAVYAGYYSRFASQWTYLANLYNQIMATQAQAPGGTDPARSAAYANWMAGFVEDAEDIHLATKPMYAAVIKSMLEDDKVRDAYARHTVGGTARLEETRRRVNAAIARANTKYVRAEPKQIPEPR